MAKIGDKVRFLDSEGEGIVTKIDGNIVYVEVDGFDIPTMKNNIVVVDAVREQSLVGVDEPTAVPSVTAATYGTMATPPVVEESPVMVEEYEGGDVMNLVVVFEPVNVKEISKTGFVAYLVNDSNYFINFSYLTLGDGGKWTMRCCDTVEPNVQIRIDTFAHEDLPQMERIAIQGFAYKRDKEFDKKTTIDVERKIDGSKFYKLHVFQSNEYFDTPVLMLDIVRNDKPYTRMEVNPKQIEAAMRGKLKAEAEPTKRPIKKHDNREKLVIDLHINALLDSTAGMDNYAMLQQQLRKVEEVMKSNLKRKGKRIVFIHGKGDGVLRKEVLSLIKRKYPRCLTYDASFQEYGFGATEVEIH